MRKIRNHILKYHSAGLGDLYIWINISENSIFASFQEVKRRFLKRYNFKHRKLEVEPLGLTTAGRTFENTVCTKFVPRKDSESADHGKIRNDFVIHGIFLRL